MSDPEPVDYQEDRPARHRLTLSDGTHVEVHYAVSSVTFMGFDPTGLPLYQLQAQPMVRFLEKPTRRAPKADAGRGGMFT